jgi:hypothetical protein
VGDHVVWPSRQFQSGCGVCGLKQMWSACKILSVRRRSYARMAHIRRPKNRATRAVESPERWLDLPKKNSSLTSTSAPFSRLISRLFRLVFSAGTIFLSQKKISWNSVSAYFFSEVNGPSSLCSHAFQCTLSGFLLWAVFSYPNRVTPILYSATL